MKKKDVARLRNVIAVRKKEQLVPMRIVSTILMQQTIIVILLFLSFKSLVRNANMSLLLVLLSNRLMIVVMECH